MQIQNNPPQNGLQKYNLFCFFNTIAEFSFAHSKKCEAQNYKKFRILLLSLEYYSENNCDL